MSLYEFDLGDGLTIRVKDNICTPEGIDLWVRVVDSDFKDAIPPAVVPIPWAAVLPPGYPDHSAADEDDFDSTPAIESLVRAHVAETLVA